MKISCYGSVAKLRIFDSIVVAGTIITAIVASDLSFAPITCDSQSSRADSDYLVAG